MHFGNGRTPRERAVRHVAAHSSGPALDPALRVTLNDKVPVHERPVYGGLNFRRQLVSAAPRLSSFHFRLVRTGRYGVQDLKKVWHCLARFGAPPQGAGTAVGGHTPGVSTPSA